MGITRGPEYYYSLSLNKARTRGIGDGFILDLKTLRSTPTWTPAFWNGSDAIGVHHGIEGGCIFTKGFQEMSLASGWRVISVSTDGQTAFARKNDRMSLLRLTPGTWEATEVASYENTPNEYEYLDSASYNPSLGKWLVTAVFGPTGWKRSYLGAKTLTPIHPGSRTETENICAMTWVSETSPWALALRQTVSESKNGSKGYDRYYFKLWNARDLQIVNLAERTNYWRATAPKARASAPVFSAPAIDWPARKFAYVVQTSKSSRIYLLPFSLPPGAAK